MESLQHKPDTPDASAQDVRAQVQALLETRAVSQAEVARQAGISASAVNRWVKDTYGGDNAAVEQKLRTWLEARARQTGFDLPEGPAWIATRTAERVVAALSYGQMAADLVVVYGPAGIGKTAGVRRYAATRPNVFSATMSPATATTAACLEEVLYALGVKDMRGMGAARMQRDAVRRLRDTRGLLAIDEAQHLSLPALETLRAIHDAAGIGLALIGNEQVYSRLTGNGKSALFAQLFSRIGRREALRKLAPADVEALAAGWEITCKDGIEFLRRIADTPGALRQVVKTLRLASAFAAGAGEPLGLVHLKSAWRDLGGEALNGRGRRAE